MMRMMTRMGHRPKDPSEMFVKQAIFRLSVKGPVSFPGGKTGGQGGRKDLGQRSSPLGK